MNVQFKIDDREFKRTLEKYATISTRSIPEIVNTKAFFIARRAVAIVGKPKGSAVPARSGGWTARAIITNMASARHETKEALYIYGEPALQAAINFETESMKEYILNKMRQDAKESGIKTHG